mgnify:FL=1|tara:strand:- start:445 stop:1035 length:591 start_codon:yes stop_codon:yes gene_type:complete
MNFGLGAAFMMLTLQQVAEPPTTVNGIELGTAAEFSTVGPAVICMQDMLIRPSEGETVQLLYSGIHFGTLRLTLADATYVDFSVSGSFADHRRKRQKPVAERASFDVYRVRDERKGKFYQIEDSRPLDEDDFPSRVVASGTALRADRSDFRLFEQVDLATAGTVPCDVRYDYGWGVILNGDPVRKDSDKPPTDPEN